MSKAERKTRTKTPLDTQLFNQALQDAIGTSELAQKKFENVQKMINSYMETLIEAFKAAAKSFGSTIDPDSLDHFIREFAKKPYFIIPMSEREWWLVVPSFVPIEFGYLLAQEGAWNIFVVNQYSSMIQEIPIEFQEALHISKPFGDMVIKGDKLILQDASDDVKAVRQNFSDFLGTIKDKKTILIQKGKEFELLAALIRQGILPFKTNPVKKKHKHEESRFLGELREYQQRDYDVFEKESGAIGILYPMSGGKSFPVLQAIGDLIGKKLILVPNLSVQAQWKKYLLEFTTIPEEQIATKFPLLRQTEKLGIELAKEIHIVIYNHKNLEKIKEVEYIFGAFDEAPAMITKRRIAFAQLNIEYRMTCTATPFREDGNQDLIFALCVRPRGVDWKYFIENNLIKIPSINIYVDADQESKYQRLEELLDPTKKTLIYCDGKDEGYMLAKRFGIPFVSGDVDDPDERLEIIMNPNNKWVIVSRVGDMGISIKDLEVIIEIDFLFSSRHQETQRVGRLFHSDKEGEYYALVTVEEYLSYKGRFLELYRQGLKPRLIYSSELPFNLRENIEAILKVKKTKKSRKRSAPKEKKSKKEKTVPGIITETTKNYPKIDERSKLDAKLFIGILKSEFAKNSNEGLSLKVIRAILDFNNVTYTYSRLNNLRQGLYDRKKIGARTVGNTKYYFFVEDL